MKSRLQASLQARRQKRLNGRFTRENKSSAATVPVPVVNLDNGIFLEGSPLVRHDLSGFTPEAQAAFRELADVWNIENGNPMRVGKYPPSFIEVDENNSLKFTEGRGCADWDAVAKVLTLNRPEPLDVYVYVASSSLNVVKAGDGDGLVALISDHGCSIEYDGTGDGDAVRAGSGYGYVRRVGGLGHAIRLGSGNGEALRSDGRGNAVRGGKGLGDAIRRGRGDGDATRYGDGDGDALNVGPSFGHAIRAGSGAGDATRGGEGDGDAIRMDSGVGEAARTGSGKGSARTSSNAKADELPGVHPLSETAALPSAGQEPQEDTCD